MSATWGAVFEPRPERFGLRGDPHVWEEMRQRLGDGAVPADRDAARDQLERCFESVAQVRLDDPDLGQSVYREHLANGGMSSGHVHLETWRERLLPLLVARAADHVLGEPPFATLDGSSWVLHTVTDAGRATDVSTVEATLAFGPAQHFWGKAGNSISGDYDMTARRLLVSGTTATLAHFSGLAGLVDDAWGRVLRGDVEWVREGTGLTLSNAFGTTLTFILAPHDNR